MEQNFKVNLTGGSVQFVRPKTTLFGLSLPVLKKLKMLVGFIYFSGTYSVILMLKG